MTEQHEIQEKIEKVKERYAYWQTPEPTKPSSDCGHCGDSCHGDGECGGDGE